MWIAKNVSPFFDLRYQSGGVLHETPWIGGLTTAQNIYKKKSSLCNGNTRSCLLFPEEPLEAVGCAIPLPELNRIWAARSPPDTGVPKAILPSHSAASQPRLYGMLLCSLLLFCIIFTKDRPFTDQSYSSKPGFIGSLADFVDSYSQGKYLSCFSQSHFYTCQIASPFPTPSNAHEDPIVSFRSISSAEECIGLGRSGFTANYDSLFECLLVSLGQYNVLILTRMASDFWHDSITVSVVISKRIYSIMTILIWFVQWINTFIMASPNNTIFFGKPAALKESDKVEISTWFKNIWPRHGCREKMLWTFSQCVL